MNAFTNWRTAALLADSEQRAAWYARAYDAYCCDDHAEAACCLRMAFPGRVMKSDAEIVAWFLQLES